MTAITIDTREFEAALREYEASTTKALPDILNQRAFNVAARTMDAMKPAPGGEQAERAKIRSYMNEQVSTRVRLATSGKRKGKFLKRGARGNQLARVNLIIQARRAKAGLKGIQGQEMRQAEGRFKLAAQVGVGFLKSPFIPVIKGLHALVKFKRVATRWARISVWPGSDGWGKVNPAKTGWNPFVAMEMRWKTKGTPEKVQRMVEPHMQAAFNAEGQELMRHVQEKLQQDADRINAR